MIIEAPRDTPSQVKRDMPRKQYWGSDARFLLLSLIKNNPSFVERAEDIRHRFQQFEYKYPLDIVHPARGMTIGRWDETGCWHPHPGIDEENDAVQYCRELAALAQDFGLRCEWGPTAIHFLVNFRGTYPGDFWTAGARVTPLTVYVLLTPGTKWSHIKNDVVKEAKNQFEAAAATLREQSGFPMRDRGPENLEQNVELLYQRICLGLSPMEIWNKWESEHELDECLTYENTRNIISNTAQLLGISL